MMRVNPHVRMMAWSTMSGEAHLTKDGIQQIKSTLMNQIFKQEMRHTYLPHEPDL